MDKSVITISLLPQANSASTMNGEAPKEQRKPKNRNKKPASAGGKPNGSMSNGHHTETNDSPQS